MKWQTEQRKISDLVEFDGNPRQMTEKQVADLTASLQKFDLAEIPAITTNNKILAGHQRLRIMAMLGRGDEVIDVRVPDRELSEDEEREYLIRSNRNSGEWDWDALANGFDVAELTDWGFDEGELGSVDWEDYSEDQAGAADRGNPHSSMVLVCFGEFAGRVDKELADQATEIVRAYDLDPDAAATALCRRLVDES